MLFVESFFLFERGYHVGSASHSGSAAQSFVSLICHGEGGVFESKAMAVRHSSTVVTRMVGGEGG